MFPLAGPPEHSVFLDATELHSTVSYVSLPLYIEPKLATVKYYVSRLTVEELAVQLYQDFSKHADGFINQYPELLLRTSVSCDLSHFQDSIIESLQKERVKIFDVVMHGVVEQKLLFEARHHGAYKDVIIFSSAIAYAKANSLPRCSFVTQDKKEKDFGGLQRILSKIHPMKLLNRAEFKDVVSIEDSLYEAVVLELYPILLGYSERNRAELARRSLLNPQFLVGAPEMLDSVVLLLNSTTSFENFKFEVNNIVVRPSYGEDVRRPKKIVCRAIVRYSIPDLWGRLYWVKATADIFYDSEGSLSQAVVNEFEMDWLPFA